MRIASLPWYDFQELTDATDALWAGFAAHMVRVGIKDVPDRLDRTMDHTVQWRQPQLLLSQACGYDVLYDSADDLTAAAVPTFTIAGCDAGTYRSAVVVRDADPVVGLADLCGRICVINEACSHSGTNALRPLIAPLSREGRFFREVVVSGDHTVSLEMVARGQADVACIDVVVWEICRRVRPDALEGLRILRFTDPAPAPPWVTSQRTPPEVLARLRQAILSALADPGLKVAREQLLLGGAVVPERDLYRALATFEEPAARHAYLELPAPRRSPLSSPLVRGAATVSALAQPRSGCGPR